MTIANLEAAVTAAPADVRQMRNAIIASVLGWSLDLFDLFILLYVAPVVGALFFPSTVPTLSLAAELLGQKDRINTPGTVDATNWTYRLPMALEDLEKHAGVNERLDRIRELVKASGR